MAAAEDQLIRLTSFAQYEADWFPGIRGAPAERWAATRAEIAAVMAPGDELWEWKSAGFQSLAGDAGLAVVRGGKVVRAWSLWKS